MCFPAHRSHPKPWHPLNFNCMTSRTNKPPFVFVFGGKHAVFHQLWTNYRLSSANTTLCLSRGCLRRTGRAHLNFALTESSVVWISPYCNCLSTIHMTSLITSLSGSDSADAWYASTGVHSTFSLWIYLFLTSLMSDLSASNVASSCCFYSNTEQSKVLVIKEWVAPICRPTLPTARSRCSLVSRGIHVVIVWHAQAVGVIQPLFRVFPS